MRKRTYKDIEASRNARLWITSVVLPTATLAATLYSNDEIRKTINSAVSGVTNSIKSTASKVKNYFETKKKEKEDKVNA